MWTTRSDGEEDPSMPHFHSASFFIKLAHVRARMGSPERVSEALALDPRRRPAILL